MDKYSIFLEEIKKATLDLKKVNKSNIIRVISHLDSDGICSAAIILNALTNENFRYNLTIIKQLSKEVLIKLKEEEYKYYIFTDLGSGQYDQIIEHLPNRKILILDHHSFDKSLLKNISEDVTMINPHIQDIDGSIEISGSGVSYLFSENLNEKNKDTAHLAIIGALGDVQENEGFSELNNGILNTAITQKKILLSKGLKWFGLETRSLIKLLVYGTEIYIPEITGNESNAVLFLNKLNIEPRKNGDWIKFNDLTETEKNNFISAIIMKRKDEDTPEQIFGTRYLLIPEDESSNFRDLREFSTLLNACGRMDKASYGIGACLNDEDSRMQAIKTLEEYRGEIVFALRWYDQAKKTDKIKITDKYIIIDAESEIRPTIIGTLASIITNFKETKEGTIILSVAKDNDHSKVSIRIKGDYELDLRDIIKEILTNTDGEGGGHKNAAGAIIPNDSKDKFIEVAVEVLDKLEIR